MLDTCAWHHGGVREPGLCFRGLRGEGRAPAEGLSAISSRPYLFFAALFSQYRNASIDITQASWSCAASAESNLAPEQHSCQADKTLTLSFTLKCFLFFLSPTSKIHKAAKLLTCVREPGEILHSFMPFYAKLPAVYLKNTEHFSTIKKHVIW